MANMKTAETAADVIQVRDFHRDAQHICPGCGEDSSRQPLVTCAYTFASCDCDAASYPHLVEQLWHMACLAGPNAELVLERRLIEDAIEAAEHYNRGRLPAARLRERLDAEMERRLADSRSAVRTALMEEQK